MATRTTVRMSRNLDRMEARWGGLDDLKIRGGGGGGEIFPMRLMHWFGCSRAVAAKQIQARVSISESKLLTMYPIFVANNGGLYQRIGTRYVGEKQPYDDNNRKILNARIFRRLLSDTR